MAAASIPVTEDIVDDVDPDESVSNVSGATNTSTMYVRQSRRQAAFAAKQKIRRQQQLHLERSLAEIENEEMLVDIERRQRENQLEQDRLQLQVEKQRAELSMRRKIMEISMREINAEAETADQEEEVDAILKETLSQVGNKNTESEMSGPYHDASNVLPGTNESNETESSLDQEETVREDPSAMMQALVTSTSAAAIPRPSQSFPATSVVPTDRQNIGLSTSSTLAATTTSVSSGINRLASTSLAATCHSKVNDYLNTISLSPLLSSASPERMSSTLRPSKTIQHEHNVTTGGPLTVQTNPTINTKWNPVVSAGNYRLFGDGERTVNFREPLYDTNVPRKPPEATGSAHEELAQAMKRLAVANEAVMLPKSEILRFDGSARNFQRFLTSFDMNVDSKGISDSAKLTYLIQYCDGKAKELIEDCIMFIDPSKGYQEARQLLKTEYGKRHEIARACIDALTRGNVIAANDHEGIIELAKEMKRCYLTLTQINYMSDLQSSQTQYAILRRLPDSLQQKWMEKVAIFDKFNREATYEEFLDFIGDRAAAYKTHIGQEVLRQRLERKKTQNKTAPDEKKKRPDKVSKTLATSSSSNSTNESSGGPSTADSQSTTKQQNSKVCTYCKKEHMLHQCDSFKELTVEKREEFVKENSLCFNCLKEGHSVRFCTLRLRCRECRSRHNTLLHTGKKPEAPVSTAMCAYSKKSVAFPIVAVTVTAAGKRFKTLAVLDQCSDATLCTTRLLKKLNIQGKRTPFTVDTVNGRHTDQNSRTANINIESADKTSEFQLRNVRSVLELPISATSLAGTDSLKNFTHLSDVTLPDMQSHNVDILIGSDAPDCFVIHEQRVGASGEPYAQRFPLGWAVIGPLAGTTKNTEPCSVNLITEVTNDNLSEQLSLFWRYDFPDSISSSKQELSLDDKIAKKIVTDSVKKVDGRYMLKMPFRSKPIEIPNNRSMAETRQKHLLRKLQRDATLRAGYIKAVEGYVTSGYARKLTEQEMKEDKNHGVWYIPHHAVLNPKKPGKVRVVHDCAAKYAGKSLNDHLYTGPDILNSLLGVLFRFRQENVAIVADVEAMYHRVLVYPEDQQFLRFLWWDKGDVTKPYSTYCMTVQVFGAGPSGYNANLALRSCADDGIGRYKANVIEAVHRNFYVDDFIMSVPDEETAIEFVSSISRLLAEGGFRLHKWLSTSLAVVESVPKDERAGSIKEITSDAELPQERALGINWDVARDGFVFDVNLQQRQKSGLVTKRIILSISASLFDPIGFLSPVLLVPKLIMQQMCRSGLDWDDPAPEDLEQQWKNWLQEMPMLSSFCVDRCLKPTELKTPFKCELHYFSDASEIAYGAVCYLKIYDECGHQKVSFLMGKSRLAPIKLVTIPRLELCAAVLAARLHELVKRELTLPVSQVFFWCDSTSVLCYIRNTKSRFQTFVANRLCVIHDLTEISQWYHIEGKLNPADLASRGFMPTDDEKLQEWITGPSFLVSGDYPIRPDALNNSHSLEEQESRDPAAVCATTSSDHFLDSLINRCGTWAKIKQVVDYVLLFLCRRAASGLRTVTNTPATLSAKSIIIQRVQQESFGEDFKHLKQHKEVMKCSKLSQLCPFIDEEGTLRVRGRIENSHLPQNMKTPILLPKNHRITYLMIEDCHRRHGHVGVKQVISLLRQEFWILRCLAAVKTVIGRCVVCNKAQRPLMKQMMAPLPVDRLTPDEPPFSRVGIDFFGPLQVRVGRSTPKRWGVIFTCLNCRGVHFEISHSLNTDSFLAAFTRFTARRGVPHVIFTDNGTNFVAAEKELKEMVQQIDSSKVQQKNRAIKWNFLPPHASHMAGVWERLIRSTKTILRSLLINESSRLVTDEILSTLLCEVEAIMNDRPLTPNPTSLNDAPALTPNMLLTYRRRSVLPPGVFDPADVYSKRWWRQAQHLADVFWRRWVAEYIPTLQLRQKWTHDQPCVKIDDIVLVSEEPAPRGDWPLGRVTDVKLGTDQKPRSATVLVRGKEKIRPISKLVLLEHHPGL